MRDLLNAVTDLSQEDRRELMNLLHMTGESPIPEIVSTSHDETMVVPRRDEPPKQARAWMLVLLILAGVGLGWFFLRGQRAARLQINSHPTGAKVFVNDLEVGITPMNQPLVAGDKLRLELKGFEAIRYEFKPGEEPPVFPFSTPVISQERLESIPEGATVVMDEVALEGVTPLTVRWNQGQPHRLSLSKENLVHHSDFGPGEVPSGRVFELKEGITAESRPEPALDPNAPGSIKLAGGFGVRMKVDGKDVGDVNPGAKLPLAPGSHRLDLASSRHYYKDSRTVTILAGQSATVTVPGLATLTVETFPGTGKVLVDGQDAGIESDGSSVQVSQGRHTITVRGAKGIKHETLEVNADKNLKFPL